MPDPANYRLTAKEKGEAVGRLIFAVALTAVSISNPMTAGAYNYYYVFVPNLNVKVLPDSSAGLEALEQGLIGQEDSSETKALRRHIDRTRMIRNVLGKRGLFVTGGKDEFDIMELDMMTGKLTRFGSYGAEKVHGIELDVVYGLAIVGQNERQTVNILDL